MKKILVSACLIGEKVRYNSEDKLIHDPIFETWMRAGQLIPICPEVVGGLPTPRPPSEMRGNRVFANTGEDVTQEFNHGAQIALSLCKEHSINIAILKSKSPSCGVNGIYDGSFSGNLIKGFGVTAKLLKENGILVFTEDEVSLAERALEGTPS